MFRKFLELDVSIVIRFYQTKLTFAILFQLRRSISFKYQYEFQFLLFSRVGLLVYTYAISMHNTAVLIHIIKTNFELNGIGSKMFHFCPISIKFILSVNNI